MAAKGEVLRNLYKSAKKILRILGIDGAKLDIFLADDELMRALKRRFFHKEKSADVLSFSEPEGFPHPETKEKYLGEVYLNWNMHRKNPERTTYLLAHGVLHLLGYDHFDKNDIIKMERKEKELMRKL